MEIELVQSLQDIGYEGPLVDTEKLREALEKGAKSVDFTGLVSWLAEQLRLFGNIEEHVQPTMSPEDSSSFLLELSSFLKELGCVNNQLISGNVNQRLATKQERILLLEYLIVELMACKINQVKKPNTNSKLQLTINESDTAKCLKDMLIAVQIGKPPDNITVEQLFSKLEDKLKAIVSTAPPDLLGRPLVIGELSDDQWKKIDQLQDELTQEYKMRREMLLQRLDVTVQSFLWSDKIKPKESLLTACYHKKRDEMSIMPNVTLAQLLAARDDIAIIEKTSNAAVRKNTQSNVTKVIIGNVPDRGGRSDEQAPPPPEMPSWQKNRVADAPRGGRGGNRGGNRGGYQGHKDVSSNFGQNRDWHDQPQASGSFHGADNRGEHQRGGRGGGGYHRGRGGRVQGGWAQGGSGGGGYNRGGNRSQQY